MKPDVPFYHQAKSVIRIMRGLKWNLDFSYFRKWILIGFILGIVAGLGAIGLYLSVEFFTGLFLKIGAGYAPPLPGGFQANFSHTLIIEKPWLIPLITGLGGLLVGLITTKFSPESEGHGTDAVIDAYHHKSGIIRARVPLVKAVASSITIGSGGSGGTEGPAGQIAAGFGSLIGKLFKLDEDERRIAVAAGLGAGIGSIFKIPLGGAVFSAEVFYRRDFEVRLSDGQFLQLPDKKVQQVRLTVIYSAVDPATVGKQVSATMKVYAPNGAIVKTTSVPNGIDVKSTDFFQFVTALPNSSRSFVTTVVLFTDLNNTSPLSNSLKTKLALNKTAALIFD